MLPISAYTGTLISVFYLGRSTANLSVLISVFYPGRGALLLVCFCLFGVYRPTHSYGDVTITGEGLQIFDLCSALMFIERFFSVSPLLWPGAPVSNCQLRRPVILTPIDERLAVELSLPGLSRLGFEHPTFRLRGQRSNPNTGMLISVFYLSRNNANLSM